MNFYSFGNPVIFEYPLFETAFLQGHAIVSGKH